MQINKTDYDDLFTLHQNSQVRKYLGGKVDKAVFEKKFEEFLSAKLPEIYWVVREKSSKNFIGFVSISKHHDKVHYEISYELKPSYWGQGYGYEVVKEVIDFAFNKLKIDEIYAETQKKNIASIKLLNKVGMSPLAEIERFGEQQVIYSIKYPLEISQNL